MGLISLSAEVVTTGKFAVYFLGKVITREKKGDHENLCANPRNSS